MLIPLLNREGRYDREGREKNFAFFACLAVKISECMFYSGDNLKGKERMRQVSLKHPPLSSL